MDGIQYWSRNQNQKLGHYIASASSELIVRWGQWEGGGRPQSCMEKIQEADVKNNANCTERGLLFWSCKRDPWKSKGETRAGQGIQRRKMGLDRKHMWSMSPINHWLKGLQERQTSQLKQRLPRPSDMDFLHDAEETGTDCIWKVLWGQASWKLNSNTCCSNIANIAYSAFMTLCRNQYINV